MLYEGGFALCVCVIIANTIALAFYPSLIKNYLYNSKMKQLALLIENLDSTTKTTEKVNSLLEFFNNSEDADKIWLIALFTGRRPRRTIKLANIRLWAAEFKQIPNWLFEESYNVVGDLAETIALLIGAAEIPQYKSLNRWMTELKEVRNLDEILQKDWLFQAWSILGTREIFILNKLLTGGFRMGVSEGLLLKALEKHTDISKDELALKITGNWDPYLITFQDLILSENKDLDLSKPYPFYLAHPIENNPEEIFPNIENCTFEYKWDGIRGQLISREQAVALWSRGQDLINDSFPEIVEVAAQFCDDVVLDGELVVWDEEMNIPQTFGELQKRLGRKKVGKVIRNNLPVKFIVYDILEIDKGDIRQKPLEERRKILQNWYVKLEEEAKQILFISQSLKVEDWQCAKKLRLEAKEKQAEGLMLKAKKSHYGIGRKRGDWWKWKLDPETIDAVLIYAQRGHGRRANLYTDFTFALMKEGELVPFAKAYSGLSNTEIEELNKWIKDHTRESFGPVRSVDAEQVFEIAFEGVSKSKRHKSGVAVRFPRIVRWRKDKTINDINSVDDLIK